MSVPPDESKRTKQKPQKNNFNMGTHITIFEAVLISGASLFVYVFIKTLIQHFKSK